MKEILIGLIFTVSGIMVGMVIGLIVRPRQHTEITLTSSNATVQFKSNRIREKDTYLIIMDGDTISRGVVIDGEWY
jgi:hypothetical protein